MSLATIYQWTARDQRSALVTRRSRTQCVAGSTKTRKRQSDRLHRQTRQALRAAMTDDAIRKVLGDSKTLTEAAATLHCSVTTAWRLSLDLGLPSRRPQPVVSDDDMRAALDRYPTRTQAAKALGVSVQRVSARAKRLGYPPAR